VYLSLLGKTGLRTVAELTYRKARYASERLGSIPGYRVMNSGSFFREFVVRCPIPAEEVVHRLATQKIIPGLPLSRYYPDRTQDLLVCVTELNTKEEIDRLADALSRVGAEV
jgi:glycine dehydrogenase subunit 1